MVGWLAGKSNGVVAWLAGLVGNCLGFGESLPGILRSILRELAWDWATAFVEKIPRVSFKKPSTILRRKTKFLRETCANLRKKHKIYL